MTLVLVHIGLYQLSRQIFQSIIIFAIGSRLDLLPFLNGNIWVNRQNYLQEAAREAEDQSQQGGRSSFNKKAKGNQS